MNEYLSTGFVTHKHFNKSQSNRALTAVLPDKLRETFADDNEIYLINSA